jgi:hypothetical protein
MFENLNAQGQNLNFLEGNSAQELLDQIKQIKLPIQIMSMYAVGSRHFVWFISTANIKKITKGK